MVVKNMKIKTLKDIEFFDCGRYVSSRLVHDKLRAEAVKRVKNCKNRDMCSICGDISFENKILYCDACKRDIWFNNLTEEDLSSS